MTPPRVNIKPATCAKMQAKMPMGSVRLKNTASGMACEMHEIEGWRVRKRCVWVKGGVRG